MKVLICVNADKVYNISNPFFLIEPFIMKYYFILLLCATTEFIKGPFNLTPAVFYCKMSLFQSMFLFHNATVHQKVFVCYSQQTG